MRNMNYTNDEGITLIALVVTIIVLMILAGVSVSMLTGQNGILNRAAEAKEKSVTANEKEAVSLATMEALTEGKGIITEEILTRTLKSYLGKNDIVLSGDGPWQYTGEEGAYTITEGGSVASGWIYIYDENGAPEQVTNGKATLNIGDYVNYNPGTEGSYTSPVGTFQDTPYTVTKDTSQWQCAEASAYQELLDAGQVVAGNGSTEKTYSVSDASNIKWKVLGVDEETGELLIVAADVLKNEDSTTKKMIFRGITGYTYGVDEINKVCSVYGKGKGATGGRSITLDDINKVIGKAKGTNTAQYTYTWTTDSLTNKAPSYNGGANYLYYPHVKDGTTTGVFNYYNTATKKWETNTKELDGFEGTETIGTIKPDYVEYDIRGEQYDIYRETKGYDVVFKTDSGAEITGNDQYWLGSSYCYAGSSFASWGMYYVYASGFVYGYDLYYSFGSVNMPSDGVRPVVSLQTDIQLEKNTEAENTYDIKSYIRTEFLNFKSSNGCLIPDTFYYNLEPQRF